MNNIHVILIYIPERSVGGGLTPRFASWGLVFHGILKIARFPPIPPIGGIGGSGDRCYNPCSKEEKRYEIIKCQCRILPHHPYDCNCCV